MCQIYFYFDLAARGPSSIGIHFITLEKIFKEVGAPFWIFSYVGDRVKPIFGGNVGDRVVRGWTAGERKKVSGAIS